MTEAVERRLAAILSADAVGYSRPMAVSLVAGSPECREPLGRVWRSLDASP